MQELCQVAVQAYASSSFGALNPQNSSSNNSSSNKKNNKTRVQVVAMSKAGFPPQSQHSSRLVWCAAAVAENTEGVPRRNGTLREAGLQHHDKIAVTLQVVEEEEQETVVEQQQQVADTPKDNHDDQDTAAAATTDRPQRRHAAVAATTRIAQEIQKQQQQQQQDTTRARKNPPQRGGRASATTAAARHFAALERRRETPPTANTSHNTTTTTAPRRLRDGAMVHTTKRRKFTNNNNSDNDDAGRRLEAWVTGAAAPTAVAGRMLRQGWRAAVQSVYEQNQAAARVATRLDQIQIVWRNDDDDEHEPTANAAAPDDHSTSRRTVSYPKGVQGRAVRRNNNNNNKDSDHHGTLSSSSSMYVDADVDVVEETVLQAVVQQIHATHPEGLRAENLALLSPRVLWSLVVVYQQHNSNNNNNNMTVGELIPLALRQIQPHLDWSFLRRRPTMLSAKARENLRQQQQEQQPQPGSGSSSNDNHDSWEAAAHVMQAVEQALQGGPDDTTTTTTSPTPIWTVITPDELDCDELLECIHAAVAPEARGGPGVVPRTVVLQALQELNIHNWRELANVENDSEQDDFYQRLLQVLEEQGHMEQDNNNSNKNNNTQIPDESLTFDSVTVSPTTVQAWIDYAQFQSVQEIMVECCQDNADAVDLLIETVNCGTPRDLTLWQTIVPVLEREIIRRSHHHRNNNSDNGGGAPPPTTTMPDQALLYTWCHRAQCALEQLPWLQQYVTPIQVTDEDDNDEDEEEKGP